MFEQASASEFPSAVFSLLFGGLCCRSESGFKFQYNFLPRYVRRVAQHIHTRFSAKRLSIHEKKKFSLCIWFSIVWEQTKAGRRDRNIPAADSVNCSRLPQSFHEIRTNDRDTYHISDVYLSSFVTEFLSAIFTVISNELLFASKGIQRVRCAQIGLEIKIDTAHGSLTVYRRLSDSYAKWNDVHKDAPMQRAHPSQLLPSQPRTISHGSSNARDVTAFFEVTWETTVRKGNFPWPRTSVTRATRKLNPQK